MAYDASCNQDRRKFLKTSSAAVATGLVGSNLLRGATSSGDTLRIGLVGCGGRGTGAASQALHADPNAVLHAVGDAFANRIEGSQKSLASQFQGSVRSLVAKERQFVGMDAFQQVIDSGVDVVLLATPPGFRPQHLRAAIDAGKHVFAEKPMAVDGPGIRSVIESARLAGEKSLSLVAGFCWRYSPSHRAAFQKLEEGAIGDLTAVFSSYFTGPVKPHPGDNARPEGMADVEWQMRNWYNYSWLSGDSLPEQACHSIDKISWALGDIDPIAISATGGRQVPANAGNIFDHFHVVIEYPDNVIANLGSCQIPGGLKGNSDVIRGTKGALILGRGPNPLIEGEERWRFRSKAEQNMYQVEHDELFASIRSGKPINDGTRMARSSLMAIAGRISAYRGQRVTWAEAMAHTEDLAPDDLTLDSSFDPGGMPIPGTPR